MSETSKKWECVHGVSLLLGPEDGCQACSNALLARQIRNEQGLIVGYGDLPTTFTIPTYFTVLIPPSPFPTKWHASDMTCTRGSFDSYRQAVEWGQANLQGQPYIVRRASSCSDGWCPSYPCPHCGWGK